MMLHTCDYNTKNRMIPGCGTRDGNDISALRCDLQSAIRYMYVVLYFAAADLLPFTEIVN